jgi:hypothetical protein
MFVRSYRFVYQGQLLHKFESEKHFGKFSHIFLRHIYDKNVNVELKKSNYNNTFPNIQKEILFLNIFRILYIKE